ncbi:MAG: MFS transporter [Syntrophales bacterium]
MKQMPYQWKALLIVSLGAAMTTLDASIITIAFPELTRVFHTDLTTIMWITVAYILVSSSLMLLFGKLSDFVGRKKIYTVGFGIFTLAMVACSLAQSVEQLIVFRVIQGVGAAMAIGCSTAIVTEAFPGSRMGKGLGLLGVAVSAGFIIGPVAGGFLLEYLDWRAIFYARIPLSLLAFILAIILLKEDMIQSGKIKLDLLGAVTSFAGLLCFLFGMGQIKAYGLKSAVVITLTGTGLLMLCLLPLIERRAKNPIIDFGLFKNRDFTYAMAGFFLFFLTMPVYIVLIPFYLMDAIKLSAADVGLLLSVIPVTTMIASPISGALSDRFGPRWPSTLGAGAVAVAFFCMFRFNLQTEIWMIVLVLTLLGIGSGVFQPPNNSTIMNAVDPKYHGSASAMLATNRQVAMSIGLTLTGLIFSTRQIAYYKLFRQEGVAANIAFNQAIPAAFGEMVLLSFFLTLIVLGFSLLSPKKGS